MRKAIVLLANLLVLIGVHSNFCGAQEVDWKCDYTEAKRDAYFQSKFLLVYFTGLWNPLHSKTEDSRMEMEEYVWRDTSIIELTRRYICVQLDCYKPGRVNFTTSNKRQELIMHHRVMDVPTAIITDHMDNEVARITGFVPADQVRQILNVQFPHLSRAYQALQELEKRPDDAGLQIAVADAYSSIGIPQLSNQCYEKVLNADTLKKDVALREKVDFGRAVNYSRLNQLQEGIDLFEKQLDDYPGSTHRPHCLLWLVRLYLQALNETAARKYLDILEKEFPASEQTISARGLFVK